MLSPSIERAVTYVTLYLNSHQHQPPWYSSALHWQLYLPDLLLLFFLWPFLARLVVTDFARWLRCRLWREWLERMGVERTAEVVISSTSIRQKCEVYVPVTVARELATR